MVRFFREVDDLDSIALRRGSTTPNQNSCTEGPRRSVKLFGTHALHFVLFTREGN